MANRLAFRRWAALAPQQRRAVVIATTLLPFFALALRTMGLARMQTWIALMAPAAIGPVAVDALAQSVDIAARRGLFRPSCLTRSMLLAYLLKRQGTTSELRIGVRLEGGSLDAHAWLECDGLPINDRTDIGGFFAPFDTPVRPSLFRT